MGLTKWAQNKIKEKVDTYKADRQFEKNAKKVEKVNYQRGYRAAAGEAATKGAYERGQASYNNRGKSAQGVTGRVGQAVNIGRGVNSGLQNFGDTFLGRGGSGVGLGDFGFGGSERPKAAPPQRTVTYSARTGNIKVSEPVQPQVKHEPEPDFWMGAEPAERHGKKHEKHPYDIF